MKLNFAALGFTAGLFFGPQSIALALDEDLFVVEHKPSGLKLSSCSEVDGTPITSERSDVLDDCTYWRKLDLDDGTFRLINSEGKFAAPISDSDGANIAVQPSSWTGNWTRWQTKGADDGFERIQHYASGKYIFASGTAGQAIELRPTSWSGDYTRWSFSAVSNTQPNYIYLMNKATGYHLGSCGTSDGTPVVSSLGDNELCDQWYLEQTDLGYFFLKNRAGNLHIGPESEVSGSPINLVPNSWTGHWTQWGFEAISDGYGYLKHRYTGKHIYVAQNDLGDPIQLQPASWVGDYTRWLAYSKTESPVRNTAYLNEFELTLHDNLRNECCGLIRFEPTFGDAGLLVGMTGTNDGFSVTVPESAEAATEIGLKLYRTFGNVDQNPILVYVDDVLSTEIVAELNADEDFNLLDGAEPTFYARLPRPLVAGQEIKFVIEQDFAAGEIEALEFGFNGLSIDFPPLIKKSTLVDLEGDKQDFQYFPADAFDKTQFEVAGNIYDNVKSFRIHKVNSSVSGEFDVSPSDEQWSFGLNFSKTDSGDFIRDGVIIERDTPSETYKRRSLTWEFNSANELVVLVKDEGEIENNLETWVFTGLLNSDEHLISRYGEDGSALRFVGKLEDISNTVVPIEDARFTATYFNLLFMTDVSAMWVTDSRSDGTAVNLDFVEYRPEEELFPDALYRVIQKDDSEYHNWNIVDEALVNNFFDSGFYFATYAMDYIEEIDAYEMCGAEFNTANSSLDFELARLRHYCETLNPSIGTYFNLYAFNESVALQTLVDGGYLPGVSQGLAADADGDGILDSVDADPLDPFESLDSDGDGIGDNGDLLPNLDNFGDLDNDGIVNIEDPCIGEAGETGCPGLYGTLLESVNFVDGSTDIEFIGNDIVECIGCPASPTTAEISESTLIVGVTGEGEGFSISVPNGAAGSNLIGLRMMRGADEGVVNILVDGEMVGVVLPQTNSVDWVTYSFGERVFYLEVPIEPLIAGQKITILADTQFSAGSFEAVEFNRIGLLSTSKDAVLVDFEGDMETQSVELSDRFAMNRLFETQYLSEVLWGARVPQLSRGVAGNYDFSTDLALFDSLELYRYTSVSRDGWFKGRLIRDVGGNSVPLDLPLEWQVTSVGALKINLYENENLDSGIETWTITPIESNGNGLALISVSFPSGVYISYLVDLADTVDNEAVSIDVSSFVGRSYRLTLGTAGANHLMDVFDYSPELGMAAVGQTLKVNVENDLLPLPSYRNVESENEDYSDFDIVDGVAVHLIGTKDYYRIMVAHAYIEEINGYEVCDGNINVGDEYPLAQGIEDVLEVCRKNVSSIGYQRSLYVFDESVALAILYDGVYVPGQQQGSQMDADGDGTSDQNDVFPLDFFDWVDSDGDNVGDNADDCPLTFGDPETGCNLEDAIKIEIETPGLVVETFSNGINECGPDCLDDPGLVDVGIGTPILSGVFGVGDGFVLSLPPEANGKKWLVLDMFFGSQSGAILFKVDDDFEMVYSIDGPNSYDWVSYIPDTEAPYYIEFPFELEQGMRVTVEPVSQFSMGNTDAIRFFP